MYLIILTVEKFNNTYPRIFCVQYLRIPLSSFEKEDF